MPVAEWTDCSGSGVAFAAVTAGPRVYAVDRARANGAIEPIALRGIDGQAGCRHPIHSRHADPDWARSRRIPAQGAACRAAGCAVILNALLVAEAVRAPVVMEPIV